MSSSIDLVGYFAFGSNMSSVRLIERVGPIVVVGRALLPGYRHRFSKRGADGTGKGNIEPDSNAVVHGVLYRLTLGQLEVLTRYEGGYRSSRIEVQLAASLEPAWTFVANAPQAVIPPAPFYIEHYWAGIREHGISRDYMHALLAELEC